MAFSEIQAVANAADQLIRDGFDDSASRLLFDKVPSLVQAPFGLDAGIRFLVHYTSIDVLFSMLSCNVQTEERFALSSSGPSEELGEDSNYLRMYDTFHSNDPNEGQFLISSKPARHRFPSKHPALWELLTDHGSLPAYVACFRGISKLKDVDDLVFWRTYGKNGQGCAVVFPVSFFGAATPVLQVKYGKTSVRSTLDHLSAVFGSLASSLGQHILGNTGTSVARYISSSLSPIPYLHKAADYKYEKEIRVVVPFVDLPPKSLFCHPIDRRGFGTTLRHFANLPDLYVRNILRTDSMILLGPAVPSKQNVRFVLKQRLKNIRLVGTKVCTSKIDYRS